MKAEERESVKLCRREEEQRAERPATLLRGRETKRVVG